MRNNEYGGWRVIVFWLSIAAAAAIGGFAIGWSWRDIDHVGSLIDFSLQAMTAFGTVGAVIVALWIGLNQRRDKERDALLRARLVACGAQYKLSWAVTDIRAVINWFKEAVQVGRSTSEYLANMERLKTIKDVIASQDIFLLTPLANDCAWKLGQAIGILEWQIKMHETMSPLLFTQQVSVGDRNEHLNFISNTLEPAHIYLQQAWLECQNAALGLTDHYRGIGRA